MQLPLTVGSETLAEDESAAPVTVHILLLSGADSDKGFFPLLI